MKENQVFFLLPLQKKGCLLMNKYNEKQNKSQCFRTYVKKHISPKAYNYLKDCGSFLGMIASVDLKRKKQVQGNSCKNRFCPLCAWKKARKDAYVLTVMIKYLQVEHEKEFIFLTLTAPNVSADDLENEIRRFNKAFKNLFQRKQVKQICKGYVRKLEITYNKRRNDYHPHFHILIAVNKSYFTDKNYYLSQKKWLELWQDCMSDFSITQVHVQKFKSDLDDEMKLEENQKKKKGIYEIAKYSAKESDYLYNQKVFEVFYSALKGKQTMVYGGLFKDAMKKFKSDELDAYKNIDPTKYIFYLLYNWNKEQYIEVESRFLTEEEIKKWTGKSIDEAEVD